jgi:hypothetical protein
MTVILLFWLFASACCAYAFLFGGRDGLIAAALIAVAVLLSCAAEILNPRWTTINLSVMTVDIALWIGLLALMLRSRRYWPIWMAAAQSLTVASHLATLVTTSFAQKIYAGLATVWSLPCLLCMVLGIALDRRGGGERSP